MKQLFGQMAGTFLFAGFFGFLTVMFIRDGMHLAAVGVFALGGYILWAGTKDVFSWVELNGTTFRARHFYYRYELECLVEEIAEVRPRYRDRTAQGQILSHILGPMWGVRVFVRGSRQPVAVYFNDPAMTNAKELVEAVLYHMNKLGNVSVESVQLNNKPKVQRIYRADVDPSLPVS